MNRRVARLLTRLYPPAWRERYGEEFEEFLAAGGADRDVFNVLLSAMRERAIARRRAIAAPITFRAMLRRPEALIPLGMSLAALAVLVGHLALFGVAREADEGAAAHIWQLLMALQLPVLALFALRWLPRAPRQTLGVLALEAGAFLASLAPVFLLNL
jgi:hypothetical protein